MRAVGYFRESTAAPRSSIAQQNRRFLDFCDDQGFEVAATFSEDGKQTTHAFGQLLNYLKEPEKGFLLVVTPSPATFAEDQVVAAARCLQVEHLGGRVQFMDGGTAGDGDAMAAILSNFSTARDDGMREKVKSALRKKAVRGEVLGRPPYGYRVGPRNRLEVVDDEAVVVRYIFRLYLQEDLGIRLIARRLNEEGLRTRRNAPWSMVSIRDILRNRAYLGTYQRLGVRVPGTHAALTSPEDFRRVQDRLIERRTNYSPRKVSGFLLSGMLICGYCGNRLIGVSRKQSWTRRRDGSEQVASYRYYQCESRTNQGICSYHTHRVEDIEEQVRQQLAAHDPKELAAAGDDSTVISQWQSETRRLKERLGQVDRRLGRYQQQAAAAGVSNDHIKAQGLQLAEERLKVEEELRDSEWRTEHYASAAERRRTRSAALDLLVTEWETLSLPERQQLLKEFIENVRVTDDEVSLTLRP
jgi:DNA invertase Pin-like site-specific DNA recombinase